MTKAPKAVKRAINGKEKHVFSITMPLALKKKFKAKCIKEQRHMSEVLTEMAKKYVG